MTVETNTVDRLDGATQENGFDESLRGSGLWPLTSTGIKTFQINAGFLCNQACKHCHVNAGPERTEIMTRETMELCLDKIKEAGCRVVDITGGAPEMNPEYRWFVKRCREMGCRVMTRTNLTVLLEEGYVDLPGFFADNRVEVVASLPYFTEEMTDRQRGRGVYARSIEALKRLNSAGYGRDGTDLALNLVYNPCGAFLPPPQKSIEADFRRELERRHNITFSNLFTITNMPIGRFMEFLKSSGNLKRYLERLKSSYNPEAARNAMCRELVSVGWDGSLYDCDFNQMIGIKCNHGAPEEIRDFSLEKIANRRIVTGVHCYGCTAGGGSSCTGAVAD